MTDYGNSDNYGAIISTSFAGSGETATPDGDKIYFLAKRQKGHFQNKSPINRYMGGISISYKTGERNKSNTLYNCWVVKYSSYDNTQSFNAIFKKIQTLNKMGGSPVYLFMINFNDNPPNGRYIILGSDSSVSTFTSYLKGYPTMADWELKGGKYYIPYLKFEESLS
ncbi:MAG: hypothetical protein ACTSYF_07070 [Promethearchaeota archaeon]